MLDIENNSDRARIELKLETLAKSLGVSREFKRLLRGFKADYKALSKSQKRISAPATPPTVHLENDEKGIPLLTISNFVEILENDPSLKNTFLFNLLQNRPEHVVNGDIVCWQDSDDAWLRDYCEKQYQMYSPNKMDDALRIVFSRYGYHPVRDIITSLKWDGIERIDRLFVKWLKADDTEYNREVCRLFFAGGINRAFNPGCKFDDMVVFVGGQGCGKSSFSRWLALNDKYYCEVSEIDGQKGCEAIEGAWVCEMSELLALKRTKDVEATKAFITRQIDKWRAAYDRRVSEHPRQCVFIGTTNNRTFLTDKTGNRRYYPVFVNSVGYDLYAHETEIRQEIEQCWAEAYEKFKRGEMPPVANPKLLQSIQQHQSDVVEDDYRIGLIDKYLESTNAQKVCVLELWERALDGLGKPQKKESCEIAQIMDNFGWERRATMRFADYGIQRGWVKPIPQISELDENGDLPF